MSGKTYKLYKIDVKLTEKAIRELVLNNNFNNINNIIYELEFKSSELNEFKNNFIIYCDNENFYVVPISYKIEGDINKLINEISESSFIKDYKERFNSLIEYYEQLYNKEKMNSINLYNLYNNVDVYIGYGFSFLFGFKYVKEKVEEFVNLYILKNKKIPSNDEVKKFLIDYLTSYDLKDVMENIINKLKLVFINI
ncbi:MAG: hypothetical protein QW038_01970 [Nanopusillaceae archaeon]